MSKRNRKEELLTKALYNAQKIHQCNNKIDKLNKKVIKYTNNIMGPIKAILNTDTDFIDSTILNIITRISNEIIIGSNSSKHSIMITNDDKNTTPKDFEKAMMEIYNILGLVKYKVKYDFLGSNIVEGGGETIACLFIFDEESVEIIQNEFDELD